MNDEKQLLKERLLHLTERPAMYVGKKRFDYLLLLYYGWSMFPPSSAYKWMADYDIQKWLFLEEAVSIRGAASLNGWSLMQRCYGNRQEAITQFKNMLEQIDLSSEAEYHIPDTVSWHIYQIYSTYKWNNDQTTLTKVVPFMHINRISNIYYPLSTTIKNIIGKVKHSYNSIIPLVTRMISEPYSDVLVYLHYEHYFLCVRFLYCSENGDWIDSTALSYKPDYYNNMVILHAYAALIQKERHRNHIVTLHYQNISNVVKIRYEQITDVWYGIFNDDVDITACDERPMSKSYAEWKQKMTP
jgi:hypothetical protein